MFCNNSHTGANTNAASTKLNLGAPVFSAATHWDIEELISLMEWSRKRVGQNGIVIVHNTVAPMFATQNFATYVLGMEFGYGRLSQAIPRPEELPIEWSLSCGRARGVITYGTLARSAPKRLRRAFAVLCVMTATTPWPAEEDMLEVFQDLRPLGDLERLHFEDYRNDAVRLEGPNVMNAIYSRPGEAWVLLGNAQAEPRQVHLKVDGARLRNPISRFEKAETWLKGVPVAVNTRELNLSGLNITVPADSLLLVRLTGPAGQN